MPRDAQPDPLPNPDLPSTGKEASSQAGSPNPVPPSASSNQPNSPKTPAQPGQESAPLSQASKKAQSRQPAPPPNYYDQGVSPDFSEGGFLSTGPNTDPHLRQGGGEWLPSQEESEIHPDQLSPEGSPLSEEVITSSPDQTLNGLNNSDKQTGTGNIGANPANQQGSFWDRFRKDGAADPKAKNAQSTGAASPKPEGAGGKSGNHYAGSAPGSLGKNSPPNPGTGGGGGAGGKVTSAAASKAASEVGGAAGAKAAEVAGDVKTVQRVARATGGDVTAAVQLVTDWRTTLGTMKKAIKMQRRVQLLALAPACLPLIVGLGVAIGVVIGIFFTLKGNPVPTDLSNRPTVDITSANPEGLYLEEMLSSKPVYNLRKDPERKRPIGLLGLEATSGRWVVEVSSSLVSPNRICWNTDNSKCLAMTHGNFGKYNENTGTNSIPWTNEDAKYYVNARWPYSRFLFDSAPDKRYKVPKGFIKNMRYYAGQKIIIYNLDEKKAAVAVLAEWGPEPWSGMCQATNHDLPYSSRTKPGDCAAMRTLWNGRGQGDFRIPFGPPKYTGWIAGGPGDFFTEALGFSNDDRVIIGYAKDQNLPLGELKNFKVIKSNNTSNSLALNVPGVEEGRATQCGMASINMVALYYVSGKGTNRLPYASLPAAMREFLVDQRSSNNPDAWFRTNPNENSRCVTPVYLNNMGRGVPNDWQRWSVGGDRSKFNSVIRSVQSGDPVIIYTNPGGWYANSQHIYVLVGYDPATGEFIVNNPYPIGVDVGVRGGDKSKPAQTVNHLFIKRGELGPFYNSTFIIRSTYL